MRPRSSAPARRISSRWFAGAIAVAAVAATGVAVAAGSSSATPLLNTSHATTASSAAGAPPPSFWGNTSKIPAAKKVGELIGDHIGGATGIEVCHYRIGAVWGPLGRPFSPVDPPAEAWMVAGGVGLAPFATLAASLGARGVRSTLFYGARRGQELFCLNLFRDLDVDLVPQEDWAPREAAMAQVFADFLARRQAKAA